jgi:ATP-binding cassette subfamily B protein
LREQLADRTCESCWLVRAPARGPLTASGRRALRRALLALAGAYLSQYLLWAFAWQRAAAGALDGATDRGELWGWLLALLSTIPLQAVISWHGARHSLDAGAWLRQRLLGGLVARGSELTRGEGLGRLLGRVLEAGAIESLGLGGGLLAGLALIDLAAAAVLLGSGAEAVPLLCLFGAALLLGAWRARRALALRAAWTRSRLDLTHDLVERMAGQRTRLVQEPPEHWHRSEDAELERYLEHARLMDTAGVRFASIPRAWLAIACAYVAFRVVPQGHAGGAPLALALGGILLGYRALAALSAGIGQLTSAWIAWQSVAPLLRGACATLDDGPHAARLALLQPSLRPAALEVRQLALSAPGQARPLLRSADVTLRPGDRALLEGPSGSGKSSLARVLAGMSRAEHGSLLLGGADAATLGKQAWRRRVTLVPQFHDNHLFSGTLAFNLLLGRAWPPTPLDLAEAHAVCSELGLGPLLERMPLGLEQVVGETGWQLSHGERSRVFAARALLAPADVVLLDESLAAVDPGTAHTVLDCAEQRARSLLLIAHLGRPPR